MPEDQVSQSDETDANRGKLPPAQLSGAVTGSGAGAGGGGGPEDYDGDPENGGGKVALPHGDRPNRGADASEHGSR